MPEFFQQFDTGITFGFLSILAAGQLVFTIKYMKETKGKTLEEIEHLW